jgi:hypothetical protein
MHQDQRRCLSRSAAAAACDAATAAVADKAASAAALLDAAELYLVSLLSRRLAGPPSNLQQQLGRCCAALSRLAGLPSSHAARRRLATDLAWVQAWEGVWQQQQQLQQGGGGGIEGGGDAAAAGRCAAKRAVGRLLDNALREG